MKSLTLSLATALCAVLLFSSAASAVTYEMTNPAMNVSYIDGVASSNPEYIVPVTFRLTYDQNMTGTGLYKTGIDGELIINGRIQPVANTHIHIGETSDHKQFLSIKFFLDTDGDYIESRPDNLDYNWDLNILTISVVDPNRTMLDKFTNPPDLSSITQPYSVMYQVYGRNAGIYGSYYGKSPNYTMGNMSFVTSDGPVPDQPDIDAEPTTAVPEPASTAILSVLAGAMLFRRRRTR